MRPHYIILPTLKCNLTCGYCYQAHHGAAMSAAVKDALKAHFRLRLKNGMNAMDMEFFGGEPLLEMSTLLDLAGYARTRLEAAGGRFQGGITTNAVLLQHGTLRKLVDGGISRYQITLDPPEDHDVPIGRVFPSGKPAFDIIWSNLEMIRRTDYDLEVMIRIHFRPDSLALVRPLVDDVNHAFASDSRFTVHFHAIERLGGPIDDRIREYDDREAKNRVRRELQGLLAEKRMIPKLDCQDYACYASDPNCLVVMPDGRLCKCTVDFDGSCVGSLQPDGRVQVDDNLLSAWAIGHILDYPDARRCPRKILSQARNELARTSREQELEVAVGGR